MGKNIDKVIKSSYDIHCDKCGKYLFTEKDVIRSGMSYSVTERDNDKEDYEYLEFEDIFVCNECLNL